jgi:uncharacterized protein YdhG (YjbR/CyaY superfamily)
MARLTALSVDEYIRKLPPAAQAKLRQIRAAIRRALPQAEETISYQIPTFELHGAYVVYFARQRTLRPGRRKQRPGPRS